MRSEERAKLGDKTNPHYNAAQDFLVLDLDG